MFTCKGPLAVANREFFSQGWQNRLMNTYDISSMIKKMILGTLRHVHNNTTPSVQEYGYLDFGGGITVQSIMEYQANIGWTNFLCGRWRVKWKEVQNRHFIWMNKKKSPRLWIIAILKELMLIRWDMWQFRNAAIHSPTGTTLIASHYSLNYRISEKMFGYR